MARVHKEAVSSGSKVLASAIRKFASSLAHTLEPTATTNGSNDEVNTTPLWEAYVVDILRHLSPTLGSAPQGLHGRALTAFLASFAAEGGLMTLNKVLECCYPRFLGVLSMLDENDKAEGVSNPESSSENQTGKQKSQDEEKLTAAMRGIAALVSSCRVALQKWQRDNSGAKVHPHPLSSYVSDTIKNIAIVLNEAPVDLEVKSLPLAAAGALKSVLTSADLSVLEEEDMISLKKTLSMISRAVLSVGEVAEDDSANLHEWCCDVHRPASKEREQGQGQLRETELASRIFAPRDSDFCNITSSEYAKIASRQVRLNSPCWSMCKWSISCIRANSFCASLEHHF